MFERKLLGSSYNFINGISVIAIVALPKSSFLRLRLIHRRLTVSKPKITCPHTFLHCFSLLNIIFVYFLFFFLKIYKKSKNFLLCQLWISLCLTMCLFFVIWLNWKDNNCRRSSFAMSYTILLSKEARIRDFTI